MALIAEVILTTLKNRHENLKKMSKNAQSTNEVVQFDIRIDEIENIVREIAEAIEHCDEFKTN